MAFRARRVLWLSGLLAMIGHMVILIAGAIGMADTYAPSDSTLNQPFWTSLALSVEDVGWPFVILNAALDVPIIAAHCLTERRRLASRLFVASVAVRLIMMAASVAAAAHLAHIGSVQLNVTRMNATWRIFHWSDVFGALGEQLLLAFPLLVYSLRWLPLIWLPHRRRNKWIRDGCCGRCGYDLRTLATERCPECGTARLLAAKHDSPDGTPGEPCG